MLLISNFFSVKMGKRFACHVVNLFDPTQLFSINCISLCKDEFKLAVLRKSLPKYEQFKDNQNSPVSTSFIEIWQFDTTYRLFKSQVIYEDEDEPCLIEVLEWSNDGRLFACGLDGRLHQVDFLKSDLSKSYPIVSGPAWCMKFNKSKELLAIGTEEGHVCVFKLDSNEIRYEKNLNKDVCRVLSLAWYEREETPLIVTGSLGHIKIWNYKEGTNLRVIKLHDKDRASVWCLDVLKPFTIVSGDSSGHMTFWDGKKGVWINSIPTHSSDVLCLSSKKKKNHHLIYSSGVDPIITKLEVDETGKGVLADKLYFHNHDVRTLLCHKNSLISGGFDCMIRRNSQDARFNVAQIPHYNDHVHISNDKIVFQYHKQLELWSLGTYSKDENWSGNCGDQLTLSEIPVKLVEINAKNMIHRSALRNNWILFSRYDKLKVLYFQDETIIKVPRKCNKFNQVISFIEFVDNDRALIVTGSELCIIKLNLEGITEETKWVVKQRIHRVCAMKSYIAIVYDDLKVDIIKTKDWTSATTFNINKLPSCVRFNTCKNPSLFIGYSSFQVTEYNIGENKFSKHCPPQFDPHLPLEGMAFSTSGFLLYDQDNIHHFNGDKWKLIQRYSHIIKLDFIQNKDELVVVEMTPKMFKEKLPSALKKKRFGT